MGSRDTGLVALRKESVDRNSISPDILASVYSVALRKESVDRNAERMKVGGIDVSVALRKESVDRNLVHVRDRQRGALSLSARRAWIEMRLRLTVSYIFAVALRKESVDRNPGAADNRNI